MRQFQSKEQMGLGCLWKRNSLSSTSLAIALPGLCPAFQSLVLTFYIRVLLSKAFFGRGFMPVYECICQEERSELFQQISVSDF